MSKYRSFCFFMMILALCFTTKSCIKNPSPLEDFLIKVDSIHIRDTVIANTPFDIAFFGTIGFDGCHSFKTFNTVLNNNNITIEAMGTFDNKAGACPTVLVLLDGHKLNLTITYPGIYNIRIKEPGYYLVNKIIVEEVTSAGIPVSGEAEYEVK